MITNEAIDRLKRMDMVAVHVRYPYQGKIAPFVPDDLEAGADAPMPTLNMVEELRWFTFLKRDRDHLITLDSDGETQWAFRLDQIANVKAL